MTVPYLAYPAGPLYPSYSDTTPSSYDGPYKNMRFSSMTYEAVCPCGALATWTATSNWGFELTSLSVDCRACND